jgi:hypothetical protein
MISGTTEHGLFHGIVTGDHHKTRAITGLQALVYN